MTCRNVENTTRPFEICCLRPICLTRPSSGNYWIVQLQNLHSGYHPNELTNQDTISLLEGDRLGKVGALPPMSKNQLPSRITIRGQLHTRQFAAATAAPQSMIN